MCGIIGYAGEREAYSILLKGLEQLEYRGYDSAGIATSFQQNLLVCKKKGRVQQLAGYSLLGNYGIAHTRWSTHGKPSDENAHPFISKERQFCSCP